MKKGFTLIELLAVIVILAIIALIAVPVILGIIDDAKESSNQRSIELTISSLQNQIAKENLNREFNPEICIVENGSFICDGESINVIDKNNFEDGEVGLIDGKVVRYYFKINGEEYFWPEDYSSCFISFIPGEINLYSDSVMCPKRVSIPSNLELPISEITSATFNIDKCKENISIFNNDEVGNSAEEIEAACMNYDEQIQAIGVQELISQVMDYIALTSEDSDYLAASLTEPLFIGGFDIETEVVDNTLYQVDTIGMGSFAAKNLTKVIIPDTITLIKGAAFGGNKITSVSIPESITSIDCFAFSTNSITQLNLKNATNLETIGLEAFYSNLITNIDLSGATNLTAIKDAAFTYNKLTSVTIPNSVTAIGISAFNYNNITRVEIGNGIESIANSAFSSDTEVHQGREYGPNSLTNVIIHKNFSDLTSSLKNKYYKNNQFRGYSGSITWDDGVHTLSE